jgi:hypothetical protein
MYNISPLPATPERPLDPPCGTRRDHDWAAVFRCHIGDEGLKVKVLADVTRADELDLDTIEVFIEASVAGFRRDIDVTNILNKMLREDIVRHFEANYDEIYAYNHE